MTRKIFTKVLFSAVLAAFSLNAAALAPSDGKKDSEGSDNPFKGKYYSVMGDSIGTDNEADTPLYTITSKDVGKPLTSWITWFSSITVALERMASVSSSLDAQPAAKDDKTVKMIFGVY